MNLDQISLFLDPNIDKGEKRAFLYRQNLISSYLSMIEIEK